VRPNVCLVACNEAERPRNKKDNAMSTKKLTLPSIIRASGLASLVVIAVGATQPAVAASAPAYLQWVSAPAAVTSTDISAARKNRQVRRTSPRDAYGSYVGGGSYVGAPGGVSQSYPGYGYGVGDNSRNQTW
jgi:hypothetical protein